MANVPPSDPPERRPELPTEAHDEQARSAAHRLGKCPICSYSLRGLPSEYRCPECGFPYDSQTRIWRPQKPKAIFAGLIGFIGGGGFLVHFIVQAPRIGIPVFVLWMGLASYIGWRCYSIYKRGQFVCVGSDGIQYRLQKAEAQLICWKDIAVIHRRWLDKRCLVERVGDQKDIPLYGVFCSPADVVEFADLANQRLTAHLKALASEPLRP
ncbi:MAG: hypothetical protein IID34_00150 [Planctomycetes bacterium]|nr:hypothetical protein [Planctomycetota bacterium]